ncbi:hypothetical protein [Micromonospora sp. NPDC050695]|uniref:hypothetical protein n=1 Tax=Micromonospora sp. NPDC050695 TaxID=3154938 RepID=UPI00340FDD98
MQPKSTKHDCTVCGFTFSGGRVQIIGGKAYCYDDAPTTDADRYARAFTALINNR